MASGPILFPPTHSQSMANGYGPDHTHEHSGSASPPSKSGSSLSDAHDVPAETGKAPTGPRPLPAFYHHMMEDTASELDVDDVDDEDEDDDEDAVGEEDADFDETTPPAESINGTQKDGTSRDASPRIAKRKHVVDEEELMQQNPELYGLRRSGRARPSRRVVESSDEDDDDQVHSGSSRKRQKTSDTRPSSDRNGHVSSDAHSKDAEESDDDVYGGARSRSFAKKHRQTAQVGTSGRGTPQLGEVRFSTRRTAKVANYNEDDELNLSEDDTENLTPSQWTYQEDTGPAIDQVLNHRLKEGSGAFIPPHISHLSSRTELKLDPTDPGKHDYQFLIKWQGQAHYHATWDEWTMLSPRRGFRRLENYFRKVVREELIMTQDPDTAPEERERWILDRETKMEELNERRQVERVIGARDGPEGTEYYVKWKALFYESNTWEQASLVSELAQREIDRFLDRSSKLPQTDKKEASLATRSDYKPFRSQPAYIKGGTLREFQIHGLNFLAHHWCKGNNVILADEMGLGKTVQTVSFINWLKHDRGQQGPFIVVVPLSTLPAWADTFNNWTPDINYVVYNGNEASRRIIREYELLVDGNPKKVRFNVLLTTYEFINTDTAFLSQLKWQFMAVDEAHRLKNRDSQLYANLLDFGSPSRLLITGTPMQNTLSELSSLMDFLMPGQVKVDEDLDLTSEHASQKIAELTNAISPYMIRRTKQKVENDLPPKTEKIIRVELADVQLEYYKNILTRNYAALNAGPKAQKTSLLNVMMELKKASNHAFMFPNAEERVLAGTSGNRDDQLKGIVTSSGKMMLIDQLLTKLKKDNHRVLIFSQMVRMLDILSDYLNLRGHQFQRLDGTIAAGARKLAIDHFNAPGSQDFAFLLSTRAGGLGINLMTADTVILFDSDWNPQADLQAMARAHRIGQKNPVTIYRLVSKDTIEEEVLERARNKLMLEFITIQRGVTDKDASKEISDKMARVGAVTAEPTSSDDISRILKKRGQRMFEQSGNQKKLEELDIDAVLENAEEHQTEQPEGITTDGGEEFLRSFEYTDVKLDLEWDQIIPKEELAKIKEVERKKAEEDYLESVIEQNQPRKRKAPAEEAREQRAAKKRARQLAAEAAEDVESDDEDSDGGADPKRPLGEKECRNLIKAFERYGSIEEKEEDVIREARLSSRDTSVVKNTLQEVLDEADRLLKAESDRIADFERANNRPITKKERKTVLFDFRGVKRLNAETLKERPEDMHMIRAVVEQVSDWRNFRVIEASKPATYTCEWGAREDGMLCVGIARHGYGAWTAIRDDEELGLRDKFFLEEHRVDKKEERTKSDEKHAKSPGAVHLVRRAAYLISVLRDKTSGGTDIQAKRALENHHRNTRKHLSALHGRLSTPTNGSASPGPNHLRKMPSQDGDRRAFHQSDIRNSVDRRHGHGSPNGYKRAGDDNRERVRHRQSEDRSSGHHRSVPSPANVSSLVPAKEPQTEEDKRLAKILDVVVGDLAKVHGATKKNIPNDELRLKTIKQGLLAIGKHIQSCVRKDSTFTDARFWRFVADHHWPQSHREEKRVSGQKLSEMFVKVAGAGKATKAASQVAPPVKSNGIPADGETKSKINQVATTEQKSSTTNVEEAASNPTDEQHGHKTAEATSKSA